MNGLLIGPYAKQVTPSKLKFWFVLQRGDVDVMRYEVTIDGSDRKLTSRARRTYEGKVPKQASNFEKYKIPDDLSAYPSVSYPRFKGDKLADAAGSLLRGHDLADVLRVKLVGELPNPETSQERIADGFDQGGDQLCLPR